MPGPRSLAIVGAAAALLAVPACSPDAEDEGLAELQAEVDDLRVELQDQRDGRAALERRVEDLEAAVADATADDGLADRLDAVDEELERVVDGLTVLEEDLAAESSARAQLAEDIEVTDRDLRNGLAELREDLDAVRGSVGLLDDQVEVLRERVDRATD